MYDSLINVNGNQVPTLEILLILTIVALLPSLIIMMTSFSRTVIILSFVSIWNEYAYAMVLLSNNKFHTLPMLLASAKGEFFVDYGLQCAAVMVAVVPIIVVYIFLQRKIVDGMVAGAVKG